MGLARLVGVSVSFLVLVLVPALAEKIEICNGGILAIEGSYSTNVSTVYYGDTLFIRVANSSDNYTILVDGTSAGTGKAVYHVTKESGTITITTSPETETKVLTVKSPEGGMLWLAKYFLFIKTSLPALTRNTMVDTVVWGIFLIPVIAVVVLKITARIIF